MSVPPRAATHSRVASFNSSSGQMPETDESANFFVRHPLSRVSNATNVAGAAPLLSAAPSHSGSRFFSTSAGPCQGSDPSLVPVGTGRPRKSSMARASRALNETVKLEGLGSTSLLQAQAEESVERCMLHGGDCDGVTVTEEHLTAQSRRRRGFRDIYPVLEARGRRMIDWRKIYKEETAAPSDVGSD